MSKKLILAICALATMLTGAKCSREHVHSVEMMNSCVEYHRRKLYPQAIRDCSKAVSLDPENEKAHHNLAIVYIETEEYEQAARNLQQAISLNSEVPIYYYQLGEVYQWMQQWERAEEAFKKAIELDDNLYKAHYRLGVVYAAMDNPQQALQKYTDALMKNGKFFDAYRELGSLYLDYDFVPQAEQTLKEGIKALVGRGDELAVLHSRLGAVYSEKGQHDLAITEFRSALELKPDMVDAMFSLGWSYSYVNKENAKIWLQKFMESAAKDTPPDYITAAQSRLTEIEVGSPIQ
ncbi:MAG: tetratricopeptide repeat protein [Deltaproteobacteria bacterium]|nr:tetratricopeptide repeat protein [Deltaproteobacteria bacterium]MBN2674376.1 tetratricopeptide repeat protein [Deltaproteobacteria bacterium]